MPTALMDSDKFKKAIRGLPDDPAEGVEFQAFWATKAKEKEPYIGLYVGAAMLADYKKEKKDGFDKYVKFHGTLHRSKKSPERRLVLFSTAASQTLTTLGKDALKACNLPHVIIALRHDADEPDLSATEQAELDADNRQKTAGDKGKQPVDNPAVAADAGSKPVQASAADNVKQPMASQAAAAPAAGVKPPRSQPPPYGANAGSAAPAVRDLSTAAYKRRLEALMPEIKLCKKLDPEIQTAVLAASKAADTNPAGAHALLDQLVKVIAEHSKKDPLLSTARFLRVNWEEAEKAGLDHKTALVKGRAAVLAAIEKKDAKKALLAMQELQKQIQAVTLTPEQLRDQRALKKLFRSTKFDKHGSPTQFADSIAAEFGMTSAQARTLVQNLLKKQNDEALALMPPGTDLGGMWSKDLCWVNPRLSAEARPQVTAAEAKALNQYSIGESKQGKTVIPAPYQVINRALWKKKTPDPPHDETHRQLQSAFAKAKPLLKPVTVTRGLNFKDSADLDNYLKPYKKAAGTNKILPLPGYLSMATAGIPLDFEGNVRLIVIAKQGLDLQPYTNLRHERELLLNHSSLFKVHRVSQDGKNWEVLLEQVLSKKKK